MVILSLKEKAGILEQIAEETHKTLISINPKNRPNKISLHGASQEDLVRVMLILHDKFRYHKTDIFIGNTNGSYPVDVGYYIKLYTENSSH